jgi:hypothetical protein
LTSILRRPTLLAPQERVELPYGRVVKSLISSDRQQCFPDVLL